MCKEIWVEATEALEEKLHRVPTDNEIEAEYQDRCSALIEERKTSK